MNEKILLEKGYRKYRGQAIDIYFNANMCQHSGICVRGLKAVFDLKRKPWILPDQASNSEVMNLINHCPSGALQYIEKVKS